MITNPITSPKIIVGGQCLKGCKWMGRWSRLFRFWGCSSGGSKCACSFVSWSRPQKLWLIGSRSQVWFNGRESFFVDKQIAELSDFASRIDDRNAIMSCSAHHRCVDNMGSHTFGWSAHCSYHTLGWCEQTTIYSTYGRYQGPLATGHSLVELCPDSLVWKETSALVSPDDTRERPGGIKKTTAQNLASHTIVYLT